MKPKLILSILLTIAWAGPVLAQQYQQLTDVPTVYIETENAQDITSKENYLKCTFIMVDGDNTLRLENTQIRGRGNSSWWNSDKKPYRVKFDKKQTLLGEDFAKAKSWTLLANHGDKTMIRNALTYQLGRFIGMKFCPAAKFIDLYLNGKYRGTYQISDQVQVHKKRVEVDEDNGWLLEVANENSREEPYITSTRYGIMYNIKNPDDELLTMDKRIAIGQWLEAFEKAVASDDYRDPEKGYRAYIDETDFINWYVGAELTGNIDALYSIYMYKEADEQKMHFGPLWDLDLGYDNSSEKSLLRQMEAYLGLWNRPFEKILQRLWLDPWFAKACNDRLCAGLQRPPERAGRSRTAAAPDSIYRQFAWCHLADTGSEFQGVAHQPAGVRLGEAQVPQRLRQLHQRSEGVCEHSYPLSAGGLRPEVECHRYYTCQDNRKEQQHPLRPAGPKGAATQ